MAIQINISPAAQALFILAVGTASIIFGGAVLKKSMVTSPSFQVLQPEITGESVAGKTGVIHMIKEEGKGIAETHIVDLSPNIANQVFANTHSKTTNSEVAPAVDYFTQLTTGEHLRLDAVTHNGAVINGKFVGQGESIEAYAYPAPGENENSPSKMIAPRLIKVSAAGATIREPVSPHRIITLKLND
jgi:hypothetical protein